MVGCFHVGSGLHQHFSQLRVIEIRGPVQGCHPIDLRGVYVGMLFKQRADGRPIGFLGRIGERGLSGCELNQREQHCPGKHAPNAHSNRQRLEQSIHFSVAIGK